jgi:type 1 fimbriae regulatory protein FimB/type 1 fimbriae regulatory protein FimE
VTGLSWRFQGLPRGAAAKLRREAPNAEFVFLSERGDAFSAAGFAKLVERAGEAAKLGFKGQAQRHEVR